MFKRKKTSRFMPARRPTNRYTPKYKHHFKLRAKVRQHAVSRATNSFRFFFTAGVFSFALVYGAYKLYNFMFLNAKFAVKHLSVSGLTSVPEHKFFEILPAHEGDNLFRTYFRKIEKTVTAGIPVIKSVSVRRDIPDTVRFFVTERKPLAWCKMSGETKYIDDENTCFSVETSTFVLPVPFVEFESAETREQAVELLSYLKQRDVQLYFNTLKLYNVRDRVTLVLNDNTKIFWGFPDSKEFDAKLHYLQKTLENSRANCGVIEYIDLKLFNEGRIIVKPAPVKMPGRLTDGERRTDLRPGHRIQPDNLRSGKDRRLQGIH